MPTIRHPRYEEMAAAMKPAWAAVDVVGARKRLSEHGIVSRWSPFALQMCRSAAIYDQDDAFWINPTDVTSIKPHGRGWAFAGGRTKPGGLINDEAFCTLAEDFEAALELAIHWYSAPPAVIQGWIVRLNRHPEWDEARVAKCVASARAVSEADFVWILVDADERMRALHARSTPGAISDLASYFPMLFVHLEPADGAPRRALSVRRDLSEAFLRDLSAEHVELALVEWRIDMVQQRLGRKLTPLEAKTLRAEFERQGSDEVTGLLLESPVPVDIAAWLAARAAP